LIRHGEAAMPDAEVRILNYSDAPLTERGREQARGVAAALDGVRVDAVVASDLHRARETAEIIAGGRAPVLTEPRLREVDLGDYDGWTFARVAAADTRFLPWPGVAFYGRLARLGYHVPADLAFPGGESARTMHARLAPGLADLAAAHPGETVVAVSHGWAIQGLICEATGCDIAHYWRFTYANSVLSVLDVDASGRGELLVHNGTLELERPTGGRLAPRAAGGPPSEDREGTCRVVLLCPAGDTATLAAELRGVEVAAVRAAPGAAAAGVAGAVEAACGTAPVVDARLGGDGDAAPASLAGIAAEALGSAVVIVAGERATTRLGAHITALDGDGHSRMPALAGGLGLAEVEADGRGVLHIWNGRIPPAHVPPG
jgi:broad specificity phosphatase PhoE